MAALVSTVAVLLACAAALGRAQQPGCWNEQMADKQRLQYGLMLVRQQIANMLTLDYIASVSAHMGSPLGVSGSSPYLMQPRPLHEHTLVLPASGSVRQHTGGYAPQPPLHAKSTTYKKEVPMKDGY
ncbi:hypothetical protein V5799_012108 [Amblyomma americanum]|uniref:Secreted protein n=1 Tax=Amblyomma americanum TaxID=6943 RepID=A0AAQ4EFB3_AMBAM